MQWHDARGKFWGATGGARQNFGGKWPPWHPPGRNYKSVGLMMWAITQDT